MSIPLYQHFFEWSWHLYETGKTEKDLPFHEHIPTTIGWHFPDAMVEYYNIVFRDHMDRIKDKTVLDIGCGGGSWLACFLESKQYIGTDYSEHEIKYSKISDTGLKLNSSFICISADDETAPTEADTIYMLGVNHLLDDQMKVFERLVCDDFILDTFEYTTNHNVNEIIEHIESLGFQCRSKTLFTQKPPKPEFNEDSTRKLGWGRRYIVHFYKSGNIPYTLGVNPSGIYTHGI